tara:strand:- start:2005 stop:3231 length:1227 start_codon:yes stop_codon:yes gene_type:complete
MAQPNGGLITETNAQYYAGVQMFVSDGATLTYTTTFNTDLVFGNFDPTTANYNNNNFKLYTSTTGGADTFTEYTTAYTVTNNTITFPNVLANGMFIAVQLKNEYGGEFGNRDAFGQVVEENYGDYSYIKIKDIVNNFRIAYVGPGKLIPSVKTTDIIFHAKRSLQEFSYDTLRSIHSQELNVPPNLSVPLPQDYVNYVNVSRIDKQGIKHIIYPTTLTSNPYSTPIQDAQGIPTQDDEGRNLTSTSITEERWAENKLENQQALRDNLEGILLSEGLGYLGMYGDNYFGQRYGLQPEIAQINGWFTINNREGKMSFSSDLKNELIILEYVSDGLSYNEEMKVPKLAEEAMYSYIIHAIIASRINQPEYIVRRLKQEKSAKLRNAKIRLSNIKLNEFVQIARGKSKWIKY